MSYSAKERRRIDIMKREVGCVACTMLDVFNEADFHHIVSGGRRLGKMRGYPLCPYHHRGVGEGVGPSLAHGSKPFHAVFGTDEYLERRANEMADAFELRVVK